jgi:hypothetical protein
MLCVMATGVAEAAWGDAYGQQGKQIAVKNKPKQNRSAIEGPNGEEKLDEGGVSGENGR